MHHFLLEARDVFKGYLEKLFLASSIPAVSGALLGGSK